MEDLIMREKYTSPEMEIIEFDTEDVITTSMTNGNNVPDYSGDGDIKIP
jgi:hypothetical protein